MPTTPKIPDLPPVGMDAGEIDRFLRAVREIVQTREGRRGDPLDKSVTFRDMADWGLISRIGSGGWYGAGGSGTQGPPGIQGPPGPPGDPYVPDYTPPPTPTGLTAVSTFRAALIEWDAPVYTQGHGNAYTKVYIAQYGGTGPEPTFADAVNAGQVSGATTIYTHYAATGAKLHIWIAFVSTDDVEGSPAGGTNGFELTIGQVGNVDLGPLSVAAGNLAQYAVEASKFAAGIEPVGVVSALPNPVGYTGPKTLLRSTDGKLFRWINNPVPAWTAAVDGADIFANSITAGQVAVGGLAAGAIAVGSAAIANGAIRNALIENLAVDNAKIANVSVDKLTAGSVKVGDYIQSTGYQQNVSGWRILGNGQAEFGSTSIRGTLTAEQLQTGIFQTDNVHTRGLTVRDANGNIILSSGTPLTATYADAALKNANITLSGSNGTIQINGAGGGSATGVVMPGNPITSGNVSTYIASAAIGTAQIGTAAIKTAQIDDLSVNSLKLAGSAVTTPKLDALAVTTPKLGWNAATQVVVSEYAGRGWATYQTGGSSYSVEFAVATITTSADGDGRVLVMFSTKAVGSLGANAPYYIARCGMNAFGGGHYAQIQIKRNSTLLRQRAISWEGSSQQWLIETMPVLHDQPGPGVTATYYINFFTNTDSGDPSGFQHQHEIQPLDVILMEVRK